MPIPPLLITETAVKREIRRLPMNSQRLNIRKTDHLYAKYRSPRRDTGSRAEYNNYQMQLSAPEKIHL